MDATAIQQLIAYIPRVKSRTQRLFPFIPPDKIEWTYREGKFTIGDIIRHLALIERNMYAESLQSKPIKYTGCGIEYAEGYEQVIQFYRDMQEESMGIISGLGLETLLGKCPTPAGTMITAWKWLRAMIEHEIHHRGQLYTYLGILGVDPPPIYGLTSEELVSLSDNK
ncbi:MAG: DinB family protein [Bacteroidota bacterium]